MKESMVEGGWGGPGRGRSLGAVLALIKGVDFIPDIIGNLLEGIVRWFVLSIIPAMLFAPWRAVTPQPAHRLLRNREMKGRKEDRRGEREREKVPVDTPTDESDGSHHCQGLGTGRAALVGGETFHPPVNIWFTLVSSSGGPRWRRGQGAGRSARRAAHRCLWLSSLAVLSLRSQITTVRWSCCAAVSFPQTKRPAQLQRSGSGQNAQAWKKLKVREQLSKAPRGHARGSP